MKMKKINLSPLVHIATLRNTVLASTRALIALIENNYNQDGSISIPKVLRPYMGFKESIKGKGISHDVSELLDVIDKKLAEIDKESK